MSLLLQYKATMGDTVVDFLSDEFLGVWYCLFAYDEWFQRKNGYNVQAEYRLDENHKEKKQIIVINSYIEPGNRYSSAVHHVKQAIAKVIGPNHAQVSFDPLHLFYGHYIIKWASDGVMIVTGKNAWNHAWILARNREAELGPVFRFINDHRKEFNLDRLRPMPYVTDNILAIIQPKIKHEVYNANKEQEQPLSYQQQIV